MATERIAVVAVNPVNGMGLFQYLEAFYENKIPCTLFAVADTNRIRTNSGIELNAHEPIASLAGHEEEYAALVFACGDAVPVFSQHADEPWNRELLRVIRRFSELDKPLIGHCGAGLFSTWRAPRPANGWPYIRWCRPQSGKGSPPTSRMRSTAGSIRPNASIPCPSSFPMSSRC